jgi:NitT/TauT family transport system substrate-binding protein
VKLVLGWVAQTEWAGYYAANALGYYGGEGLHVTIQAGGPDVNTEQLVGSGAGQFGADAYGNVLTSNDTGTDLVSLAQISPRPGLRMISLKTCNCNDPSAWKGKTIGVFASLEPFYATLTKYHLNPNTDVKQVQLGANMDQFLSGQLDITAGYTFNELGQIIAGGTPLSKLDLYNFTQDGTSIIEDQLFGNGAYVAAHPDVATKFVAASLRGWVYCRDNPQACVNMTVHGGALAPEQALLYQMNEFNKLLWPAPNGIGYMNPAVFQHSANILLQTGVIKKPANVTTTMETTIYNNAVQTLGSLDLKGENFVPLPNVSPK